MWHEARKQEKKLRVMIVDYRKRAERRREFYEKFKADPTQFMQVHGRPSKIYLEPQIAASAENCMMPWQGNADNMIDRFDVRAHLDVIPEWHNTSSAAATSKSGATEEEEQNPGINYERYRILIQNDLAGTSEDKFLHQIHLEEQFGTSATQHSFYAKMNQQPKVPKAAIGYNYEDSTPAISFSAPKPPVVAEADEESEEEIDFDLLVNVDDLTHGQKAELNNYGAKYGLGIGDFMEYLNGDLEEKEQMRLAKLQEEEKQAMSGRKARRERRAYKDKLIMRKGYISPPSYATYAAQADNNDADEKEERRSSSESRSRSNSPEKITFITSFGGNESDDGGKGGSGGGNSRTLPFDRNASCTAVFGPSLPSSDSKSDSRRHNIRRRHTSRSRSPVGRSRRNRSRSRSRSRSRGGRSRRRSLSKGGRRRGGSHRRKRHSSSSSSRSRSTSRSRRRRRSSSSSSSRDRRSSRRRRTKSKSRSRSRSRGRRRSTQSRSSRRRSRSRSRKRSRSRSSRRRRSTRSRSHSRSRRRKDRKGRSRSSSSSSSESGSSPAKSSRRRRSSNSSTSPVVRKSNSQDPPPATTSKEPENGSDLPKETRVPSPPPVRRYYGRKKSEGRSSSSDSSRISLSEDESDSGKNGRKNGNQNHSKRDADSSHLPKGKSGLSSAPKEMDSGSSKASAMSAASLAKLTPKERLRRKMQSALTKTYRADKEAEKQRQEKMVQERMEREESLRELTIKYRRREREKRHRDREYGRSSSSSSRSSRSRSRSHSPMETGGGSRSRSHSPYHY